MTTTNPWVVHCDFDGTISTADVTDSLLQRFGREGWQELEDAWERGAIGSRDCMQGQVALLAMTAEQFSEHLGTLQLDEHFAAFAAAAAERGMRIVVSSDGLDRAITTLLQRAGLGHLQVLANQLVNTGAKSWQLYAPHARATCARASGNCKCTHVAADQQQQHKVLYVGDGTSDFCVAPRADFVLAKDKLLAFCRSRGVPHRAIQHFGDALAWLQAEHPILETI